MEQETPPPPPAPDHTRRGVLRRALEIGTITTAAVGVGAGVGHRMLSRPLLAPPITEPDTAEPEARSDLSAALNEAKLWHPQQTAGRLIALVESLATILAAPPGRVFYHTIEGRQISVPRLEDGQPSLAWHNANRARFAEQLGVSRPALPDTPDADGYPLVAFSPDEEDGKTLLAKLDARLAAPHTSVYFDGTSRTLLEGITHIALAHGAPPGIALGVAAMETHLQAAATPGGIFNLNPNIAAAHLARLSAPGPHRLQPADPTSWSDPLTQTELFSAHFTTLQAAVQPALDELTRRLSTLSGLEVPLVAVDLSLLATLSALHSGVERVEEAVAAFVALPDAILTRRLQAGPYGLDAWLVVLASAVDAEIIHTNAMLYPGWVLAWSWLVSARDAVIAPNLRDRPPIVTERLPDERAQQKLMMEGMALSAGAVLAGLLGLGVVAGGLLTRRGVLTRWLPTAIAAGVISTGPGRVALQRVWPSVTPPTPPSTSDDGPAPPELLGDCDVESALCDGLTAVLADARVLVTGRMRQLRYRGSDDVLPVEDVIRRRYLMDQQTALLSEELDAWLGTAFVERFMGAQRRRLSRARPLFEEGAALQTAALEARLQTGQMIPIHPASPDLPYFCQQVGENSGLDNHPDALFMHRDFLTVLYALRALINHQIGLFNTDAARLGFPGFPRIPWVSAVKISGAFRPMMQFYELNRRYPGRTTRSLSAHTIGHALDIGALAPALPGAGVVRFAGDMRDQEGTVHVRAGELLPTAGFGNQTRKILSRMIGRSLMLMTTPLRQHLGVTLYPLWEARQLNWHVVIHVPER